MCRPIFSRDGTCLVAEDEESWVSAENFCPRISAKEQSVLRASEPNEHRFGFEQNSPRSLHGILNLLFERDEVTGFRFSAID
jgi:hypothetical protein